jgi:hypothetical protein
MQGPSSQSWRRAHECPEERRSRTYFPRLSEELRKAVPERKLGSGERQDREQGTRSLKKTGIVTMRRIDWARVKGRVKHSDSLVMTVVTFGIRIHRRIVAIERENDGMLSPHFAKRQAQDKNMGIGSYGPKRM